MDYIPYLGMLYTFSQTVQITEACEEDCRPIFQYHAKLYLQEVSVIVLLFLFRVRNSHFD